MLEYCVKTPLTTFSKCIYIAYLKSHHCWLLIVVRKLLISIIIIYLGIICYLGHSLDHTRSQTDPNFFVLSWALSAYPNSVKLQCSRQLTFTSLKNGFLLQDPCSGLCSPTSLVHRKMFSTTTAVGREGFNCNLIIMSLWANDISGLLQIESNKLLEMAVTRERVRHKLTHVWTKNILSLRYPLRTTEFVS